MSPAFMAMLFAVAVTPAIASSLAVVVFALIGIRTAIALWKLRHPDIPEPQSGPEDP